MYHTCIIEYVVINFNYFIEMITKLNIMVILTICNIMYVANNLSIIVFLFCIDSIVDSTMHIMVYLLHYVQNVYIDNMCL